MTGRLRPARPGELPDAPARPPDGDHQLAGRRHIAVVGDDLMSESVRGETRRRLHHGVGHGTGAQTHAGGEVIMLRILPLLVAAILAALATPAAADPRARVVLINFDAGTGVGLDDPTPVAPIGGNNGTTLGRQRQIALAHAASIWARNLRSFVPIEIAVTFAPRTCTATGAVLASAGPAVFVRDFGKWTTHPATGTRSRWRTSSGVRTSVPAPVRNVPDYDILAIFNVNLGQPGCLTGIPFYYGLDGNEGPNRIDLVATALHEFGHGFGVTQTVNISPTVGNPPQPNPTFGQLLGGFPDVYNRNLFDNTIGKTWPAMTVAERRAVDSERPQRGLDRIPRSRRRFRRGWLSGCLCSGSARRPRIAGPIRRRRRRLRRCPDLAGRLGGCCPRD